MSNCGWCGMKLRSYLETIIHGPAGRLHAKCVIIIKGLQP